MIALNILDLHATCSTIEVMSKENEMTAQATLQARLDLESKSVIEEAARLRHVGLSDYIRLVLVPTARKEVLEAKQQVLHLTSSEQKTFWDALCSPAKPTKAQKKLGALMKGK